MASKRLPAAAAALVAILTLISLRYPPRLGNDFEHMQRAWDFGRIFGTFNRLPVLDPGDIAHRATESVVWWSPGAQMLIGGVQGFGLSVGASLSLWLGAAGLFGVWGALRLYRELGMDERSAGWAVLLLTANYWGLYNFRQFQGADPFANALAPWLFWGLLRARERIAPTAAVLLAGALAGSFIKLSFLVTACAAAAAVFAGCVWEHPGETPDRRRPLRLGVAMGFALGLSWWTLHALFLSGGVNPSTGWSHDPSIGAFLRGAIQAAALPLGAVLSFVSLGDRLCDFAGWPHFDRNLPLAAALVAASWLLYAGIWTTVASRRYRIWLAAVTLAYVGAFAWFFYRQAAVAVDDRLFRAVAILLVPGLAACAGGGASRRLRAFAVAVLAVGAMWGAASYAYRIREIARDGATSYRGYSLADLPVPVESALRALDRSAAGDALFCSVEPEALLAIRRHRAVELPASAGGVSFHGKVKLLVLILPSGADPAAAEARFADYRREDWRTSRLSGWTFCSAGD